MPAVITYTVQSPIYFLQRIVVFIEDMNVPGFRLHALKGAERGRWSV